MSDNATKLLKQLISTGAVEQIDRWIAKYPVDQKQSAVMAALMIAQDELGYLSEDTMNAVAEYLDMPSIAVYEVATFYSMYEKEPVGRHVINVCTNISCKLRGCDSIALGLQNKLNIKMGETTTDGRFTLRAVECLGACVNAPMMQIDRNYHENLTAEKAEKVLDEYR